MNGASRAQPRGFCSIASVTCGRRRRASLEPHLDRVVREQPLERRPVELLRPAPPRRLLGRPRRVQSARTARPRAELEHRRPAGVVTPSTRCARGHQRGRWYGSPTSSHTVVARRRAPTRERACHHCVVGDQRVDVVARQRARGRRGTRARRGTRSRRRAPPSRSTSSHSARAVPPVASRSSWTSTRAPSASASACISSASIAVLEDVLGRDRVVRQLARLARGDEAGAELARQRAAEDEAARLGRDHEVDVARRAPSSASACDRRVERRRVEQQRRDVLEDDPRLAGSRGCRGSKPAQRRHPAPTHELAQVAHQQQVLEVRRDGGQVLERVDAPRAAALRVARAQRRRQELLQQLRLAVGRRLEHAQVAPGDAVARELGARAHDLAVGVVVVARVRRCRAARARRSGRSPRARRRAARDAPVASSTSSSVDHAPCSRTETPARRGAARRRGPSRGAGASSASVRPRASSWRITRSGRNSSRCRRRIVRSRATSSVE